MKKNNILIVVSLLFCFLFCGFVTKSMVASAEDSRLTTATSATITSTTETTYDYSSNPYLTTTTAKDTSSVVVVEEYGFRWRYTWYNGEYGIGLEIYDQSKTGELILPDYIYGYPVIYVYGYDNLNYSSIEFPDSVISIKGFFDCPNLEHIKLPDSLENISAFSNCSSLKTITMNEGNENYKISDGCLMSSDGLRWIVTPSNYTINVPEGTKRIYYDTFNVGVNAERIHLPSTLTSINDLDCFTRCSSLVSITVDENNNNYFSCDGALCYYYDYDNPETGCLYYIPIAKKSLAVSSKITTIDYYKNNLESITVDDDCEYFTAVDGVLFNSDMTVICLYPCKKEGNGYSIPEGVEEIGYRAFSYCENLESINIPDSVTYIGGYVFEGCSSLKSITIPDSVTYIGWYAFDNTAYMNNADNWENDCLYIGKYLIKCNSDKEQISIKPGTTLIAGGVFNYNSLTEQIVIPDSVIYICDNAFYHCSSLESITIPDSVTYIGWGAFGYCENLESVNIPDSVTYIGGHAFEGCTSLVEIKIPDSVTEIEYGTFSGCTGLRSFNVGKNISYINSSAFSDCKSLEKITVDKGNAFYTSDENGVIYNKDITVLIAYPYGSYLKEYELPETVDYFDASVLAYCYNVKKFKVAKGNENFIADNYGVIYSKDYYELYAMPNLDANEYYVNSKTKYVNLTPAFSGFELSDGSDYFNNNVFYSDSELKDYSFTPYSKFIYLPEGAEYYSFYTNKIFICYAGDANKAEDNYLIYYNGNGNYYSNSSRGILLNCSKIPEINRSEPVVEKYTDIAEFNVPDSNGKTASVQMKFSSDSFNYDPDDISIEVGALTSEEKSTIQSTITTDGRSISFNIRAVKDGVTIHPDNKVTLMFDPAIWNNEKIEKVTIIHLPYSGDVEEFKASDGTLYAGVNSEGKKVWCIDVDSLSPFVFIINDSKTEINSNIKVASAKSVDYRSRVTITATATGVPSDCYLAIYVNGKQVAKGTNTEVTYNAGQIKSDISYTVKVIDANGNVQKDANGKDLAKDGGKITVNAGFFKKLIAFFKGLFGMLPAVTIKP